MVRVMSTVEERRKAPRRPDASMSLLGDVAAGSLDPNYRLAAKKRQEAVGAPDAGSGGPTTPDGTESTGRSRWAGSIALMLGLLAIGLLISVAAARVQATQSVVSAERESLIERIRVADRDVEDLQNQVASLEADIEALESAQLESTAIGERLAAQTNTLHSAVGTRRVVGPGVTVTLDDAPEDWPGRDPETSEVLDIDIQQVVNALWYAGAEAVAVNGQRITLASAIRQANDIIQVNYRPLSAPYDVAAVGDAQNLASGFDQGPGGQWLRVAKRDYGIQSSISIADDDLVLPAGSATLTNALSEETP